MKFHTWAMGLVIASGSGCGETHDHALRDEGRACLYAGTSASSGPQTYESGQSLLVRVSLGECLSACVRNDVMSCSAALERAEPNRDGVLRIGSTFRYDDPDEDSVCLAVCKDLVAECASEPLPEGRYVIEHGDKRVGGLIVPSRLDAPLCF